ncbi:oxidoreductase [Marinicaulis flavus]|uniref:Oxidoreductase n=2 Tax=Hyphococcus luteus TaxID=2058213 RepID=A0A2S7K598_9PROT|nr:oxidoreductase [Marinicaulis flavus]
MPAIRERAAEVDKNRRVASETIDELKQASLFALMTPRAYGGMEKGFAPLVEVTRALSSACGSTGWVYGVLAGHNWMVALFPQQAQDEVFSVDQSLTASVFRLSGEVTVEQDGYRLKNGEGRFCSGVDFADWVVVGCAVKRDDDVLEPRYFLIPMSEVEVVDDWHTAGMRGTGSRSIRIKDAFIPEYRTVLSADIMKGTTPGAEIHKETAVYSAPFPVALPFSLIGAPLGMAAGALEVSLEGLKKKFGAMDPDQAGESGSLFARLAECSTDIEAATTLILADARKLDNASDMSILTPLERARMQRNLAYAAQKARYATTKLFESAGGSGIYDGSPIQRFWRDANSSTAHTAFGWDQAASGYGRIALDLPPSRFSGLRR